MSTTSADLLQRQQLAIEDSGWGERFRLVQPRNLGFWVFSVLMFAGVVQTIQYFTPDVKAYSSALTFAVVAYGLYTIPFWWFLRHNDRYSTVPPRMAVTAALFGGLVSTFVFALNANDAIRALWAKAFGYAFAFDWGPMLTAPFSEETAKAMGVVLLMTISPRLVRSPFDGFVLGTFVGLGFQMFENVSYVVNSAATGFGVDQVAAGQQTLVLRMAVGIASHWLYSAIFCAGLIYLLGRPGRKAERGKGILLMVVAMALHGVWDGISALSQGKGAVTGVLMPALIIVALVIVRAVYKMTVATERNWMGDLLAPEVANGVLQQAEADALAGTRKQRKAYLKSGHGHKSHQQADHILEAAHDLARQLAVDKGADTPEVLHARAEIARLRTV